MLRLPSFLACLLLAAGLAASQVDDLVKETADGIPPEEFEDPDSRVFPQRLAALAAEAGELGLSPDEVVELKLNLLEAWLGASCGAEAEKVAEDILATPGLTDARRHRVGLGLVAAWELLVEDEETARDLPDPVARLDGHGSFDGRIRGRAYAVLGRCQSAREDAGYRASYDSALKLLADSAPAERVPVYSQLVAAMEKAGIAAEDIETWLKDRQDDPAVAEILENLLTGAQKLVGRQAPPLEAPRLDGGEGRLSLAALAGRPVLIYFFASWCRPCETITPLVVKIQGTPELALVGVSFDNRDTVGNLAGYLAKAGVAFPVIGETLGWDSEIDEAWHVDAIPHLVLLDAKGVVADADLVGADAKETAERLLAALQRLAEAARAAPPEEDPVP